MIVIEDQREGVSRNKMMGILNDILVGPFKVVLLVLSFECTVQTYFHVWVW